MSCTEGNKKGRAVRNSNCNGIDMADDARERIKRENEWTMRHPVPTQADVGKYIVVNIGALGRDLSELGLYESARQVGRLCQTYAPVENMMELSLHLRMRHLKP